MKTIISIFLIFSCSISLAQVNSAQIDSIIKSTVKTNGPGAIVYVKQKGEVLYEKAFGKASMELDVDMKIKNAFNIGSISKEFTAMSILQLMEKGKLSLEDNLNKYVTNYSKNGDKIKIKHLLSHTSGLKSHTDTIWANTDGRKYFESMENVLNYYKNGIIKFEPGEKHDYANVNFNLLAYIVEEASGMTYVDYVTENIFKPLGMANTLIPNEGQTVPNLSTGYEFKDGKIVYARYHSINQTRGSSSIHTTVQDLAKWYEGLMSSKVVSRETLRKAWSPFVLNSGVKEAYGYGFYNDEKFGKTAIFHNGFIFGYSTSDMYFPEDDLLILVASNISDINVINTNNMVFDIAANIYKNNTPKLTIETLDTYVGNYKMKEGFTTKVFREGQQLFVIVGSGGKADKIFPETHTLFAVKDFPAKVEFLPSENEDEAMGIKLSRGSEGYQGVKEE